MTARTKKIIIYIEAIVGFLLIVVSLQIFTPLKPYTKIKELINFYIISGNYAAKDYHISPENYNNSEIAPMKTMNIYIQNKTFSPSTSTIAVGTKVIWHNEDKVTQTVTGQGWTSGPIQPKAGFAKTFDSTGTFEYHCSIRPDIIGELIVQ